MVGRWGGAGRPLSKLWVGVKFVGALAAIGQMTTALGGSGGLVSKLGLVTAAFAVIHGLVSAADPKDKMGTWIDENVPGASWVDNTASKIGLGRSKEDQAKASASAYEGSDKDIARLMNLGWSREQVIGIIANVHKESSGNDKATGDHGHAYGLGQWHEPRQADFARIFGHDIRSSTHEEQIDFINWELRHSEGRAGQALMGAKNAAEAAAIISKLYERPADRGGADSMARANFAAAMAGGLPYDPGLMMATPGVTRSSSSSSEVNIGQITVQTRATDAQGIARDIGPAVQRYTFATQANQGLQ